jgi:hypothetical protein
MDQTDKQTPLTDEEREVRNGKLLEFVNRPGTTEDQRDSIRSFILGEGLDRLLADEG